MISKATVNMHSNMFLRTHAQRDTLFFKLLFPHSCSLSLCSVFTPSSLSPYLSLTHRLYQPAEHHGLVFKKWSNGWIRKQQKAWGMQRKERMEEQINAYSSGLLSHYSGTGLSRSADWPPKEHPRPIIRPPLFSKCSRISAWAQRRAILSGFWAIHTRFVYPSSAKAHSQTYNRVKATYTASYEMMLADNGG